MSHVLEIKGITFGYPGGEPIFNDFSLDVKKGEIVSIVGPSGSGKSTLLELIAGNLKPKTGSIKKERLSFIYQDPYSSFSPTYSIINQIEDTAGLEGLDSYLKRLNLDRELLYQKPFALSGGQLQRCSILRAMLIKPKLLLADEPTSALDNITALEVMKMLVGFLDDFGIVLITHDTELAKWCSDKVVDIGSVQEAV